MEVLPKVSVLIPTYNYGHLLDETIQSVLAQTFADFELIIVDDASVDDTEQVVQKYLADKRVHFFKNPCNLGLVGNWNKCLEYAKGEYIKFLMADDMFHPQLLEKFVAVMEKYPTVSLVASNKQAVGKPNEIVKLPLKNFHKGRDVIHHTLNSYGWIGEPTGVMFRASGLKVGKFRSDVVWLPDWEMWLRLLTIGDCFIIPEPLSMVRNHAGQVTKKIMKQYVNYFEEYYLCKDIKEKNGYRFDISTTEMNKVVKKRALNCAKAMYKVLPHLLKKDKRRIFKKAFRIAYAEKVIFHSLFQIVYKK